MSSPQPIPDKPLTPPQAWQPFTPRGVAAFATGTLTRLVMVQIVVALIVAVAVVLFLRIAWFPVIDEAIQRLPDTGAIYNGELVFTGDSPRRLAENGRLAVVVDVHSTSVGHAADVEVTFEKQRVAICGALGCWWQSYDRKYTISFNRTELEPAWGAWRLPTLAFAVVLTVVSLLILWWPAAFIYLPLVRIVAFFGDRVVTWRGAWRLSAAALLPGALILSVGIILYGVGAVDLFRFSLFYAMHLVAGLVFVVTSAFFLPKIAPLISGKNPFSSVVRDQRETTAPSASNPFSRDESV